MSLIFCILVCTCILIFCILDGNRYIHLNKVIIKMLVFMVLFFISAVLDALHALFHLILKAFIREQNIAPIFTEGEYVEFK